MASGLKYQELGFVIETTASPEEILIEYDDTGSKIKGKLTPDQYFERLVVEARRSKQEFREKSNWTLVSPDKKVEKVNIVSMIKGARAIVNAEGNYVPGDLKSVYQAMTSLFALADRNGYDFKLKAPVKAKSGKKTYDLFSKGRFAWVVDNNDEKKLIITMKKASRLMIIGNTDKGDQTTDHYSMMGFTKALSSAKKNCS